MLTRTLAVAAGVLLAPLAAQCTLATQPTGLGIPGTDSWVRCSVMWDPDGAGPLAHHLVLGGEIAVVGDTLAERIAAFDPATSQWRALGTLHQAVTALAVLPGSGSLIAGGNFPTLGANLVQWTGTSWVPFAPSLPPGTPTEITVAANGDLVVAMNDFVASATQSSVHRWTGSAWQSLGIASGGMNPTILAVLGLSNGDLVVGGTFQAIGAVGANGIARWNGTTWSALGTGAAASGSAYVSALAEMPNADLVAAGSFATMGGVGAANIARWNGTGWHALGSGTAGAGTGTGDVNALLRAPNGDLFAGGQFTTAGGFTVHKVARWDGVQWHALANGIEPDAAFGSASFLRVATLARSSAGEIFAAGAFRSASGRDAWNVARYAGATWSALNTACLGAPANAVAHTTLGDLVLGGSFRDAGGVPRPAIARWDGSTFHSLGSGLGLPATTALPTAHDLLVRGTDTFVAGDFATAGGVASPAIARWDGAAWHALGAGLGGHPGERPIARALATTASGQLVVVGSFATAGGIAAANIARWNGTSWAAVGGGLPGAPLGAVAALPNGRIAVAVRHEFSADEVRLWNGTTWTSLGFAAPSPFGPNHNVNALLAMPNADLFAVGDFASLGNGGPQVARWNGSVWQAVGTVPGGTTGVRYSIASLPNGDVLATGYPGGIVRWNGTSWSTIPGGVAGSDLALDARGELAIVGAFTLVAGTPSAHVVRAVPTCPASAVVAGAGCSGSGGANALAAVTLPWLGSTFEASASGMPTSGLAIAAFGLTTTALPLASLLPPSPSGCTLWVAPDVLTAHVLGGPSLTTTLALPATPTFVGMVLHEQVVALETAAGGAIVAVTATNGLSLTLGAL
jgi:trimeric autotransporter adhesin